MSSFLNYEQVFVFLLIILIQLAVAKVRYKFRATERKLGKKKESQINLLRFFLGEQVFVFLLQTSIQLIVVPIAIRKEEAQETLKKVCGRPLKRPDRLNLLHIKRGWPPPLFSTIGCSVGQSGQNEFCSQKLSQKILKNFTVKNGERKKR